MKTFFKLTLLTFSILYAVYFILTDGFYVLTENNLNTPINISPQNQIAVYLINLDRSPDRLEKITPLIKQLDYPTIRIPAVDARKMSDEDIRSYLKIEAYKHIPFRAGEIGCYLSHLQTWKEFLASDFEFALILEDDIHFTPKIFKETITDVLSHKDKWDVCSFDMGQLNIKRTSLSYVHLNDNRSLVLYLSKPICAGAYIINKKAAQKYISHALPIKMAVDVYFTRSWELDIIFTGVEPRVAYQTLETPSHIQTNTPRIFGKDRNSFEDLNSYLSAKVFGFKSRIMRIIHNVKIYLKNKST